MSEKNYRVFNSQTGHYEKFDDFESAATRLHDMLVEFLTHFGGEVYIEEVDAEGHSKMTRVPYKEELKITAVVDTLNDQYSKLQNQ